MFSQNRSSTDRNQPDQDQAGLVGPQKTSVIPGHNSLVLTIPSAGGLIFSHSIDGPRS